MTILPNKSSKSGKSGQQKESCGPNERKRKSLAAKHHHHAKQSKIAKQRIRAQQQQQQQPDKAVPVELSVQKESPVPPLTVPSPLARLPQVKYSAN